MIKSFSDPGAEEFRQRVRSWLTDALSNELVAAKSATEDDQLETRRAWDRLLFEAGYAGLSWPKRYGGIEAGPILETIFYEEMARAHAPEGLGRIGRVMAGPIIMANGTEAQRERFLPRILDGSEIWCLGFSEPHAGSDLAAITTRAMRSGSQYEIHGRKIWTSHAHYADRCVLLAKTSEDRPRYQNISIFLLDMHQPGIFISPITTGAGDHHFNEVTFEGAVARDEDRIGAENQGWDIFRKALSFERGGAVALNHYLDMRHQCDVLLGCCTKHCQLPGAVEMAQSLSDQTELVRWHVMRINELEARGLPSRSAEIVLKLFLTELWQSLAQFGAQVSCDDHRDLWAYQYLRARAATIYGGTSEIQRNTIGKRLLSGTNA